MDNNEQKKEAETPETINPPQVEETSETGAVLSQPEPVSAGEKQEVRNPDGTFKKGVSGNPDGKPKGLKNWDTYYWEAIKKIAEANGKTAEEFDIELGSKFIEMARKGDIRVLIDLFNRRFGKPTERHELTGKDGEPLNRTTKILIIDGEDTDTEGS